MTTYGLIGSGNIGGMLARLLTSAGHDVVLSNSRGPDTLTDLIAGLGDRSRAGTVEDAATAGDIVIVTIPLKAYSSVPVEPLAGKVVIDTNNYYPERDGHIAELDAETTTSSELLQSHLPTSRVVKAFNSIYVGHLASQGHPAGAPERRAVPIAGDDSDAKSIVTTLLDELGFDAVDAGPLSQGWRFQRDTVAYVVGYPAGELRTALASATRYADTTPEQEQKHQVAVKAYFAAHPA